MNSFDELNVEDLTDYDEWIAEEEYRIFNELSAQYGKGENTGGR